MIIITGAAGFIGAAVALRLLEQGEQVVGLDNHNDYYDPTLKEARQSNLATFSNYTHYRLDITDREAVYEVFKRHKPHRVIHLAAQVGVRHSAEFPHNYVDTNLSGLLNILEACRTNSIEHLVYASSSSVYGMNKKVPFATADAVDHPISLYAATKRAGELIVHSYSHLYQLPTTGLRFFTVYGPWGRPDMAPFKFARAILSGEPIQVYNYGEMLRDFTYIDDVVDGMVGILYKDPALSATCSSKNSSKAPYALYNIGHGRPAKLMDLIHALEAAIGRQAKCDYQPIPPGDVTCTWADSEDIFAATGFKPQVSLHDGIARFVEWYLSFYSKLRDENVLINYNEDVRMRDVLEKTSEALRLAS